MSLPPMTPTGARGPAMARQMALGLAIAGLLLASSLVVVRLPWGILDPVVRYVGDHHVLNAFVKSFLVVNFVTLHVLFLIWLERKFAGWMQARLGPMHVGPKGLAQTVADAVKLLIKEDIIPTKADRALFVIAPFMVFMPTLLTFMLLPFSATWVGYDFDLAVLLVLAVSTNVGLGVLAAGWGANNKYSLLGGARACAQVLSYEIPLAVTLLSLVALEGTMSLVTIVQRQAGLWNIVAHAPITIPAFVLYMICALAELNRTPFDLPEAESELVSGIHTEYSGMRFALFYLAEFANNFFMAGLAVVLFFGGWLGPVLPPPVWFVLKTFLVVMLIMWLKWTMPRFRVDQMMGFCWKVLVPMSFILFCGTALWTAVVQP